MEKIELVYGDRQSQTLLTIDIEEGQTIAEVLQKNLLHIDLEKTAIGVWGTIVNADYKLKENDRIEIYRPLLIDPKEERRKRGVKAKKKKRRNIRDYHTTTAVSLH